MPKDIAITMNNNNIVYYPGAEGSSQLAADLREYPGISLREYGGSFAQMDPAAATMASGHGVILFRAHSDAEQDATHIAALRRSVGPGTVILALTDAMTTLAEARRLTEAGVDDVLPDTISTEALVAHINRQSTRSAAAAESTPAARMKGKIIAIAPARGGVGATTLATNLANSLLDRRGFRSKHARNKVALVDLDLQFGTVASCLDIHPRDGFYTMATDGVLPDETFMEQSLTGLPSGLSVFSAPSRVLPLDAITPEQITSLLNVLRAHHDYVVLDLPRTLVGWVSAVLEACDKLLLVTDSAVPSVRQARRLLDVYEEDNIALPVEIVVSGEKKPMFPRSHHKEAAKLLDRPLTHWLPHDPKAVRLSIDRGVLLDEAANGSGLRKTITAIGRTVMAGFRDTNSKKVKR